MGTQHEPHYQLPAPDDTELVHRGAEAIRDLSADTGAAMYGIDGKVKVNEASVLGLGTDLSGHNTRINKNASEIVRVNTALTSQLNTANAALARNRTEIAELTRRTVVRYARSSVRIDANGYTRKNVRLTGLKSGDKLAGFSLSWVSNSRLILVSVTLKGYDMSLAFRFLGVNKQTIDFSFRYTVGR